MSLAKHPRSAAWFRWFFFPEVAIEVERALHDHDALTFKQTFLREERRRLFGKRDLALRIQNSLPWKVMGFGAGVEDPADRPCAARFSRETGDLTVGRNFSAGDFLDPRDDGLRKGSHFDGILN